jgi:hypothetical protein
MKVGIFILLSLCSAATSAQTCLPVVDLIARDSKYEEALRVGDVAFLDNLLADEFVWVHNLASAVEDKATILARSKAPTEIPKARTTSEVRARVLENTVVLHGLSHVEKWNTNGKTTRSLRYQFMRTYVSTAKGCKLLSVQTMKL